MIRSTALFLCVCCLLPAALLAQSFELVTDQSGLSLPIRANGVAVADYDLDGDLDVYFVAISQYDEADLTTWNRLYSNNGDGTFSDVTLEAGVLSTLNGHPWSAMGNKFGAAWGDFNNDGYPDLFLTNVGPDELYRNNGDGTFTDVTVAAGVAGDDTSHNSSALWWDYDLDGDLDLYVSAWIGPNRMFENRGDETFIDVTAASALGDDGRTWTSLPIDANNDGLLDLYVVNDFGANKFYLSLGNKTFREATAQFGLEDEGHGMGVALGDYDNNGFFDIYLTNIQGLNPPTPNPLFSNTGQGTFVNMSSAAGVEEAGWAWGTEFFDCDHDGDEDLYVVNGFMIEPGENSFFVNGGSGNYLNRSTESGADGSAEARGLVVFDYDGDGDLDMLVANFREAPSLYRNVTAKQNWLQVELEGAVSNRNAFGAIVRVTANGKTYHRSNNGVDFLGQSILPLHFGLGNAQVAEEVVVTWPTGENQIFQNLWVNRTIRIKEGEGIITSVTPPAVELTPDSFQLLGNFPNPFNASTVVEFALPDPGSVDLRIYNLLGQELFSVRLNGLDAGSHRFRWNGTDRNGNPLGSGFYLYNIVYQDAVRTGKILYLR